MAGARELLGGLLLLGRDAAMRALVTRMTGLLLLILVAAAVGGFWLADTLLTGLLPQGDAWYRPLLAGLAWLVALLLGGASALVLYIALGTVLVAPFLEPLARRAAALHGLVLPQGSACGVFATMWQAALNSVRPLLMLCGYGVAALLAWIVPVLGPALAGLIWGYGSLRYLAFELLETHATLMGWDFVQRKEALRARRGYWIGFAGVAALLLWVPLLNLLVLPAAVAGLRTPLREAGGA